MGKDNATFLRGGISKACEFFHEEFIRQTVKAVTTNARHLVATGNREHARHARQILMERRVEAGDLRQVGKAFPQRHNEIDFRRQVFGSEWSYPPQFTDHFQRHDFRLGIERASVNHAMTDCVEAGRPGCFRETLEQKIQATRWVERRDFLPLRVRACSSSQRERGVTRPEAVNGSRENAIGHRAAAKEGELQARRTCVQRQHRTLTGNFPGAIHDRCRCLVGFPFIHELRWRGDSSIAPSRGLPHLARRVLHAGGTPPLPRKGRTATMHR